MLALHKIEGLLLVCLTYAESAENHHVQQNYSLPIFVHNHLQRSISPSLPSDQRLAHSQTTHNTLLSHRNVGEVSRAARAAGGEVLTSYTFIFDTRVHTYKLGNVVRSSVQSQPPADTALKKRAVHSARSLQIIIKF